MIPYMCARHPIDYYSDLIEIMFPVSILWCHLSNCRRLFCGFTLWEITKQFQLTNLLKFLLASNNCRNQFPSVYHRRIDFFSKSQANFDIYTYNYFIQYLSVRYILVWSFLKFHICMEYQKTLRYPPRWRWDRYFFAINLNGTARACAHERWNSERLQRVLI